MWASARKRPKKIDKKKTRTFHCCQGQEKDRGRQCLECGLARMFMACPTGWQNAAFVFVALLALLQLLAAF